MRWLVWNPCYSTLSPARYYTSILSIVSKVKSILKVIISAGPLVLTHTLLPMVHFGNHPRRARLIRLLVIPLLDEARKPQTDALGPARHLLGRSLVPGAEREICRLDLPHVARLKPDVWLVLVAGRVV